MRQKLLGLIAIHLGPRPFQGIVEVLLDPSASRCRSHVACALSQEVEIEHGNLLSDFDHFGVLFLILWQLGLISVKEFSLLLQDRIYVGDITLVSCLSFP